MSDSRWTLSAESITAAAAVVAALIALAVGVAENVQERRHNRLSVYPALEFLAELRTGQETPVPSAAIMVLNEGVGPARIEEIRIRVREPDGGERVFATWSDARPFIEEEWGVEVTRFTDLTDATLAAGRERQFIVLEVSGAPDPGEAEATLVRFLRSLRVHIDYRSIYGDAFDTTLDIADSET